MHEEVERTRLSSDSRNTSTLVVTYEGSLEPSFPVNQEPRRQSSGTYSYNGESAEYFSRFYMI